MAKQVNTLEQQASPRYKSTECSSTSKIARYWWNLTRNELKPNKFQIFVAQHRSLRKNGKNYRNVWTYQLSIVNCKIVAGKCYGPIYRKATPLCAYNPLLIKHCGIERITTKSVSVCGKHSATFGSRSHNRQQNNLLVNLSLRFKPHSSNCVFVSWRLGQSFCNLLPWTFPLAFGLWTRLIVLSSFITPVL